MASSTAWLHQIGGDIVYSNHLDPLCCQLAHFFWRCTLNLSRRMYPSDANRGGTEDRKNHVPHLPGDTGSPSIQTAPWPSDAVVSGHILILYLALDLQTLLARSILPHRLVIDLAANSLDRIQLCVFIVNLAVDSWLLCVLTRDGGAQLIVRAHLSQFLFSSIYMLGHRWASPLSPGQLDGLCACLLSCKICACLVVAAHPCMLLQLFGSHGHVQPTNMIAEIDDCSGVCCQSRRTLILIVVELVVDLIIQTQTRGTCCTRQKPPVLVPEKMPPIVRNTGI